MQLRDYQQKAVENLAAFVENDTEKSVCLMLPTGAGKTFTLSTFIYNFCIEHPERQVLVLVHRRELLQQFSEAIKRTGLIVNLIVAGNYKQTKCDVLVGMVETVNRRTLPKNLGLTVIDECHIGNFKKIIGKLPNKIIGITATPMSASKKDPLSNYFERLIIGAEISELVEQGYLSYGKSYNWSKVVTSQFKVTAGEFNQSDMFNEFSKTKHVMNAVEAYWKHCAGKKTIIFNVNIQHNDIVYEAFREEGLNVRYIDSNSATDQERKEVFEWFNKTKHGILCNVGIATTGLDVPDIEVVMLNRSTKSLPLYLQMVGRGSRIVEGKEYFTILDLGENIRTHGLWDEYRDWSKLFRFLAANKEKAAPQKTCPHCLRLNPPSAKICIECEEPFPVRAAKLDAIKDELIRVDSEVVISVNVDMLLNLSKSRGWKPYGFMFQLIKVIISNIEKQSGQKYGATIPKNIELKIIQFIEKHLHKINTQTNTDFRKGNIKWCISKVMEGLNTPINPN